ncbi:molybdenum cofactor biosynthesis protein F [Promicromonospora sp. AC04]|uniref:MoaF C-terminal domain-containing protein n=1 Tax=Promicromonospora sp. AC04 TaxID=2135723 RepID=UPI000D48D7B0|nr:MoaF C-terminal domain-containing protein [Promicromonospora sp. AC04]PUB32030.1 molybdenum cofactor biosynthesis protein F [Promicromonospora sp. AC04]
MTQTQRVEIGTRIDAADQSQWKTYDDFAAGIDTYRLPGADLTGRTVELTFDGGTGLRLQFLDAASVRWTSAELLSAPDGTVDPYDAVYVRDDVVFLNLPLASRDGEALTVIWSEATGRALLAHSVIAPERTEGVPQVGQTFAAGEVAGVAVTGAKPGPTRDLIGVRNVYRYSPHHLYEHVYLSTERYAWQCLQGEQRGHGAVDLSTLWRFADGLYLFCFREFAIPVASVWLHDLGYELRTTGIFLGINARGRADHRRAGGHVYPLGAVRYPDVQPV